MEVYSKAERLLKDSLSWLELVQHKFYRKKEGPRIRGHRVYLRVSCYSTEWVNYGPVRKEVGGTKGEGRAGI